MGERLSSIHGIPLSEKEAKDLVLEIGGIVGLGKIAETIVLGIDAWQLSDLNQFSNLAGKETRLPFVRSDVLRVKVIIGPPRTEIALPSLAIDRLFISDRLPARG